MSEPVKVSLEKDKEYYYCTCANSADKVFCDGSHQGTSFTPSVFKVEESKDYYMCSCKNTNTAQFCDGAHAK